MTAKNAKSENGATPHNIARNSIGGRIGRLVAFSVLSACILTASVLAAFQFFRAMEYARSQFQGISVVIGTTVAKPLAEGDKNAARNMLTSVSRVPKLRSAVVFDQNGNVFAVLGNTTILGKDRPSSSSNALDVLFGGTVVESTRLVSGGTTVGSLVTVFDISKLRNDFLLTLCFSVAAASLASALGLMISKPIQSRIVDPLVEITKNIKKIRQNRDFSTQVSAGNTNETAELAASFNALMKDVRSRDLVLQKVAYVDPLTGLQNRSSLQLTLDEIGASQPAAAYLIDLDGFREINDALGHSIGDAVLMDVASRFHSEVTEGTQVFRIGGDEFMIVVNGITELQRAQQTLAKFIATLYQPLKILGHDIHISACCGATLMPQDGTSSSEVMRHADLAIREAKKLNRNRTVFYRPEFEDRIQERNELVTGLRQGLMRDEFRVHYQPQVNLIDGSVLGFEALVRWQHPTRGNISPAVFIPVAEKAGLVPELGLRVLRESCRQAKAWFKQGNGPYQVSVNVSAAQLVQADFLRDVQEALSDLGLPPPLLCLELTESVFLGKSIGTVRHMFNDLRDMGISLALDDFGTGYSSLSYLEGLPFNKVKIDRAFVNGVHLSEKKQSLLAGIITLSHSLGMKVIAEGAETENDVAVLRALKADTVQGYYFAKPTAPDEALATALKIDGASKAMFASSAHKL